MEGKIEVTPTGAVVFTGSGVEFFRLMSIKRGLLMEAAGISLNARDKRNLWARAEEVAREHGYDGKLPRGIAARAKVLLPYIAVALEATRATLEVTNETAKG